MSVKTVVTLFLRAASLARRVAWLSRLTASRRSALGFWLNASRNPDHQGSFSLNGTEVVFRGTDVLALKEVLVDREYAPVLPRLAGNPAPRVLDVGSHIGLFPLWLLQEHPQARVVSVEADPQTFDILARNVRAARAAGAHWDALNAAAWDEDGRELRFSGVGPSMSHRINGSGEIVVQGVTLTSLMNRLCADTVDLLKVDIEGSEEAFLCANPDVLRRVHSIVVELHPNLCDTQRVLSVLREAYATVAEVTQRASSKPLLLCY